LRVFAYQEKFEPDDYDDEHTYASYSFNVKVAWDATTIDVTDIKTLKIYGLSVHPGSYTDRPLAAWDLFLSNLEWLRKQCSSYNIELGIETMYPIYDENRRYFLDDLEPIDRLQAMLPDLKWVLDLAHLNLWPEHRLEAIDLLRDRLLEIHISDNDGHRDLHTTITEKTWWLPYLDRLPISVPYVLETRLARIRSCHQIAIGYQQVVNLLESTDREMGFKLKIDRL
jgi:hypothetical protein